MTHHLGVSVPSFREQCRLLDLKPRDVRDRARLLRAVVRSGGAVSRVAGLLDVRDHRTRDELWARAGMPNLPTTAALAPAEFLRRQAFVPVDHDVVQVLLTLVEPG